jgi:hypothetical protein
MKMHWIQSASIVNLIQTKLMAVIYTRENISNQEFEFRKESRYHALLRNYESMGDQHHESVTCEDCRLSNAGDVK